MRNDLDLGWHMLPLSHRGYRLRKWHIQSDEIALGVTTIRFLAFSGPADRDHSDAS